MKMQNSHSSEQQLEQPCSTLLSFLISPKQSTSWYQYVIHYEYVFIHYICDIIQGQCCIFNFNGGGTKAERILSVPLIWGTKSPIWAPNLGYICYHEGNLIVIEKCYSWQNYCETDVQNGKYYRHWCVNAGTLYWGLYYCPSLRTGCTPLISLSQNSGVHVPVYPMAAPHDILHRKFVLKFGVRKLEWLGY